MAGTTRLELATSAVTALAYAESIGYVCACRQPLGSLGMVGPILCNGLCSDFSSPISRMSFPPLPEDTGKCPSHSNHQRYNCLWVFLPSNGSSFLHPSLRESLQK